MLLLRLFLKNIKRAVRCTIQKGTSQFRPNAPGEPERTPDPVGRSRSYPSQGRNGPGPRFARYSVYNRGVKTAAIPNHAARNSGNRLSEPLYQISYAQPAALPQG